MVIMPCRYRALLDVAAGYKKTGISLVGYNGKGLYPAGASDDAGIYYFIPNIAHAFNLSIARAIDVFFVGLMMITLIAGIIGSLLFFKRWSTRLIAVVGLVGIALVSLKVGDVYLASAYAAVGIIPPFLYFTRSKKINGWFVAFIFLAGLSIGIDHYIRSQAGTAVLIFTALSLLFYIKISRKEKAILTISLIVGMLMPMFYFHTLFQQRDAYFASNKSYAEQLLRGHPLWHSVYIGLGFLDNEYGLKYNDDVAYNKVRSISPGTRLVSPEYEQILKRETFKFIREHPRFVLYTLFAKLGIAFFFLLVFANIGLLAAIRYPKGWPLELSFWGAISISALPGIIVIPTPPYLLGLIALATIYGIVSINHAVENGAWRDIYAALNRSGDKSKCAA